MGNFYFNWPKLFNAISTVFISVVFNLGIFIPSFHTITNMLAAIKCYIFIPSFHTITNMLAAMKGYILDLFYRPTKCIIHHYYFVDLEINLLSIKNSRLRTFPFIKVKARKLPQNTITCAQVNTVVASEMT